MLPDTQKVPSLKPRVFHYSLDWRFLLPVTEPAGMCLLLQEDAEFDQTLDQVGLHASQRLSPSGLQTGKGGFHSVVMPFGLPVGWAGAAPRDQAAFYSRLRQWMTSGSHLLIGFQNAWAFQQTPQTGYYTSRPRHIVDQLRLSGFKDVRLFGTMPNLRIPEYMFDIEPRAMQFALRNRFRRKPALLRALGLLAGTMGWRRISDFLPCYFVLAMA